VFGGVGIKPEGERPLGILTCRWKGRYMFKIWNVKMRNGIIWLRMGIISRIL
jgi:hypothetical protein